MRLVDADALKAKAFGKCGGLIHTSDIDAMPTVDAVPAKHGRWIHHKGGYSDHYECTACGKPIVLTAKWDFCPNCGAKMDGKDGDYEKVD